MKQDTIFVAIDDSKRTLALAISAWASAPHGGPPAPGRRDGMEQSDLG